MIIDEVPSPTNLSVTDDKMLEWNFKIPQPSDLPTDFVLIPEVTISYIVYVTDTSSAIMISLPTHNNSLDISDIMINSCTRQDIAVQTLINNQLHTPNSSSINISNFSGKYIFIYSYIYINIKFTNTFSSNVHKSVSKYIPQLFCSSK